MRGTATPIEDRRPRPDGPPTVVWLHGYGGSARGRKPRYVEAWAREHGLAYLGLELSGHGDAPGRREAATIGGWRTEVAAALDRLPGLALLVGTSLDGWLALLAAQDRPDRVAGVVTLAAAPDFPARLRAELPPDARAALDTGETLVRPGFGDAPPDRFPTSFFHEAARHATLSAPDGVTVRPGPLPIRQPVRLVHGDADLEDPPEISALLAARLPDAKVTFVPGGEHLLNRPEDLAALGAALTDVTAAARLRLRPSVGPAPPADSHARALRRETGVRPGRV